MSMHFKYVCPNCKHRVTVSRNVAPGRPPECPQCRYWMEEELPANPMPTADEWKAAMAVSSRDIYKLSEDSPILQQALALMHGPNGLSFDRCMLYAVKKLVEQNNALVQHNAELAKRLPRADWQTRLAVMEEEKRDAGKE